jgi:pimeloyl-ACP methyl ester carboxylesterase
VEAGAIAPDPSPHPDRGSIDVGVELCFWEQGTGPAVLLVHETAAAAEVWRPLSAALGSDLRAIAYDRRGWGQSGAPEPYLRTTVEEQAADAVGLLTELDVESAIVCGAGLGAVVALELVLRRHDRVAGAALIEPPLLAFLPDATEGLSGDREAIERAVRDGGPAAALDIYLRGGLPHLGAGAERLPEKVGDSARARPLSLFAELPAVAGWTIRSADLLAVETPSRIVVGASTPPVLLRAGEQLHQRLGGSDLQWLGGEGLPHVTAAAELAAGLRQLL